MKKKVETIKDATMLVGVNVMCLLDEPIEATIAYGVDKAAKKMSQNRKMLYFLYGWRNVSRVSSQYQQHRHGVKRNDPNLALIL